MKTMVDPPVGGRNQDLEQGVTSTPDKQHSKHNRSSYTRLPKTPDHNAPCSITPEPRPESQWEETSDAFRTPECP